MRRTRKKYKFKLRFFVLLIVVMLLMVYGIHFFVNTFNSNNTTMAVQLENGNKIMLSAKKYINNEDLRYDPSYFGGGYPSENIGVCTDVVWQGMNGINVDIKSLIDKDISENFNAYSDLISVADPNIDFRQVPTLERFLERKAQVLPTGERNLLVWQPGDIVTFEHSHVAIVSCLRNLWGQPYIIQHGKDPAGDEDKLNAIDGMEISGHFRWR